MTGKANDGIEIDVYERQLDRIHHFFPRLDAKVSALFAVASGQIAVAALNLSANDLTRWWIAIPLAVFGLAMAWVILNLYRCAHPSLNGGNASLVYFQEIAKLRESDYIDKLKTISERDFKADIAGQIWRNSEIVACKYRYLKSATVAAMVSVIPWAILLVATSLSHGNIPIISK